MSRFKAGVSGNPSGRPKGSVNKTTKALRAKLKAILDNELEVLPGLLADLEPKDRLEMIYKLMRYTLPQVQPIGHAIGEPMDFDLDL